jgi:hypothetical protein
MGQNPPLGALSAEDGGQVDGQQHYGDQQQWRYSPRGDRPAERRQRFFAQELDERRYTYLVPLRVVKGL